MTKLTKIAALAVAILVASSSVSFAATSSAPTVTVTAVVSSTLSITADLFKNSVSAANDIPNTAMNFGTLQGATGNLRSSTTGSTGTGSVVALVTAISSGLPYTITQTGTTLTSGLNTLATNACVVNPVYAAADNGGAALVGTVGTAGSWVGTRTLYTSNATADVRTIQCIYSITDSGTGFSGTPIPLNQPAGTYTGTVIFTVTA